MDDPDATVPLPKHTPQAGAGGLSPQEVGNLMAAGADAFASQRSSRPRGWNPPSTEELQKLLPQYEISGFIARGGMGAVYKGVQRTLDRTVAIKILPPDLVDDGEANYAERFKQEARAMAKFKHPGIVTVYEAGEVQSSPLAPREEHPASAGSQRSVDSSEPAPGDSAKLISQEREGYCTARPALLYFVMEFIEGTDVAQLVAAQGRLTAEHALSITTHVCEALAYAHSRGVVHRDIKPSNVMIDADGQVKVADFGLAKMAVQDDGGLTRSNVAMGTPDFLAPESLIPGTLVDQRADLYAVGVMLYQMLTGHIPRGRFSPISTVVPKSDPKLDAIVDKAMQTDREKRYSTATELKADVESVTRSGTGSVPEQRTAGLGKSRSWKVPLAIAAVVVLGAGVFLLQKQEKTNSTQPPSALVPAWATLAPIPAFFEGRAVKLWDAPEKIPSSPKYRWVDNALLIDGDALRDDINAASVIFRASVRMNPDARDARLLLRLREKGSSSDHYALGVNNRRVEFSHSDSKVRRQLGMWPLVRPYQPDEWLRVEVRMVGDTIIIAADGAVLGIVRDAVALEPGRIALYGKSNAYFRDVSYILLDGVPEQELKALAGSPNSGRVISTSPSSATKDAPFVNTLGMKFVPVPITGGPTDKQRVLFSIWETRVQDYEAFVQDKKLQWEGWGGKDRRTNPAVTLSWNSAQDFCAWLTEKERKAGQIGSDLAYRLPSDHEWSCAAGIGEQEDAAESPHDKNGKLGVFTWGVTWPPPPHSANLADESYHLSTEGRKDGNTDSFIAGYSDGFPGLAPVGSFAANAMGLHDIGGNVEEWCEDWSNEQHVDRLSRGSSWLKFRPQVIDLSYRSAAEPASSSYARGFRVVLTQSQSSATTGLSWPHLPTEAEKKLAFTNSLGMKFVPVPGTEVLFCIHETRKKDYAAYAAAVPGVDTRWKEPSEYHRVPVSDQDDHPVVWVNLADCQGFCTWLSSKEGRAYRLPTDHEWSCAAGIGEIEDVHATPQAKSGQTMNVFVWGTQWPPPKGAGNLGDETLKRLTGQEPVIHDYDDGFATTAPVMSYPPNVLGIHDLAGNVWELCSDRFNRVHDDILRRGSSFNNGNPEPGRAYVRANVRNPRPPAMRSEDGGFRIVVEKTLAKKAVSMSNPD